MGGGYLPKTAISMTKPNGSLGQLCSQPRGGRLTAWRHALWFYPRAFQADLSILGFLRWDNISFTASLLLCYCPLGQWYFGSAFGFRTLLNLGLMPLECSLSTGSPCSCAGPSCGLQSLSTPPHHTYPVQQASISCPSLFRKKKNCPEISGWKMLYKIVVLWRAIELSERLSVEFVKPTTAFNGKLSLYCRTP